MRVLSTIELAELAGEDNQGRLKFECGSLVECAAQARLFNKGSLIRRAAQPRAAVDALRCASLRPAPLRAQLGCENKRAVPTLVPNPSIQRTAFGVR